jgi:hypothetical protein
LARRCDVQDHDPVPYAQLASPDRADDRHDQARFDEHDVDRALPCLRRRSRMETRGRLGGEGGRSKRVAEIWEGLSLSRRSDRGCWLVAPLFGYMEWSSCGTRKAPTLHM